MPTAPIMEGQRSRRSDRENSQKRHGAVKSKSQLQDDSIIGTNNSSIVSKRSVESLYYPDELHFFHHFVKKPQRRSPLLNRGYWLRMMAVEAVLKQFLERSSDKKKAVVNLGCGYDPLPWQFRTRYPHILQDAVFVDIDYVNLIKKKRDMVVTTSELNSILTSVESLDGDVLLRSDQYVQIGCDLQDLVSLQRSLASALEVENTTILFIAEVSIAYMPVSTADALIQWGGRFSDARFCLLEQHLPNGIHHPFASTMITHFNQVQTPLRPAQRYPTISDQKLRFENLGWSNVVARNLWELWASNDFLTSNQRRSLDLVEPFDEWEELALFGCHYILLVAESSVQKNEPLHSLKKKTSATLQNFTHMSEAVKAEIFYTEHPKGQGLRRFASALSLRRLEPNHETMGIFGGMGLTTRVNSIDVYGNKDNLPFPFDVVSSPTPSNRMCHTTTDMGDAGGTLLVGGRMSPDTALGDCWIYHKAQDSWERVSDLPNPQYRHQAVYLGNGNVLVAPGKSSSKVFARDFLIWNCRVGWLVCTTKHTSTFRASYGNVFTVNTLDTSEDSSRSRTGLLAGGISEDGIILDHVWHWELCGLEQNQPVISFVRIDELDKQLPISLFGASSVNHKGLTYVIGGITQHRLLAAHEEIYCIKYRDGHYSASPVIMQNNPSVKPLLIGLTVVSTSKCLVILGGGAVCFGFGTFWNRGSYSLEISGSLDTDDHLSTESPIEDVAVWKYMHTILAPKPELSSKVAVKLSAPP